MALSLNGHTLDYYHLEQPASRYLPGASAVTLADGSVAYTGFPIALWDYGFISGAAYDALRVVCPGASVAVTVTVLLDDMTTEASYNAILIWPEAESIQRRAKRALQFSLKFLLLETI